jgi:hypothetical protein
MTRPISETRALWMIIALMGVIDALWAWSLGIRIALSPANIIALGEFLVIGLVYATVRSNQRITVFAVSAAQLMAFTAAAVVLSYLTVTSKFPLIDRHLAAADAALGFDWLSLFMWVRDHPAVDRVLALGYNSGVIQLVVLLMLLPALEQFERVRELVWLIVLTMLIILPLAWLLPAESAWVYFRVTDLTHAYHLSDFTALRTGQMPEIAMAQPNGLVTFPSFHTAFGLTMIYVTRGIRFLFPVSLVLNALLIASTPTSGGHYLVDVLAGLAVVPVAIAIFRWLLREPSDRPVVAVDFMRPARD